MDFANYWFSSGSNTPPGPNPHLISESLRFRGGQYLSRNYSGTSSGQGQVWTLSMWLKDSVENTDRCPFAAGSGGEFYNGMTWMAGNSLGIWTYVKNNGQRPMFECGNRFRDPSAWFHLVVRSETTNSNGALRDRFYINGVEYTNFPTWRNESSQNQGLPWMGSTATHYIGSNYNGQQPWRGFIAEVHCCDGQSYGPEQFGEFNDDGVWVPIIPNGLTYGNWGFHLDFSDPANIGTDRSGNGNNWTPTNFELTSTTSVNYDSYADSPTNNHATYDVSYMPNAHAGGESESWSRANMYHDSGRRPPKSGIETITFDPGGQYFIEINYENISGNTNHQPSWNLAYPNENGELTQVTYRTAASYSGYSSALDNFDNVTGTAGNFTNSGVMGIRLDRTTERMTYWINGVERQSGTLKPEFANTRLYLMVSSSGGSSNYTRTSIRCSNFIHNYGTDFTLATPALPEKAVTNPRENFNIITYAGNNNGSNNLHPKTGVGFQPDLVWIKNRSNSSFDHCIFDSVRGGNRIFVARNSAAEIVDSNAGYLDSFDPDGFTTRKGANAGANGSGNVNGMGYDYVAWCWRQAPGVFDIVEYTGTGNTQNVAHNLGVRPAVMWIKNRFNSPQFIVYNHGWTADYASFWSPGSNFDPNSNYWNNTEPTDTHFTVASASNCNQNGDTYIAYLFAEIPGYMAAGKTVGNGNTDGVFVNCGFRPRYVMWKNGSTTNNWFLVDSERDSYNPCLNELYVDSASQESQGAGSGGIMDFYANGFKLRSAYSDRNGHGNYFAYMAFAEHPLGGVNVNPSPAR